jgi:hypothetical protein
MKTALKWLLPIGAAVSIFALFGLALFNRFWMGQRYFPVGYTMMRGGSHHSFVMLGASYGWLILGGVLVMVVLGVILFANRSTTQSRAEVQSEPLNNCPVCNAKLEHDWKHCPYCGYDLS